MSYDPMNLAQKPGLRSFYQYMSDMQPSWVGVYEHC